MCTHERLERDNEMPGVGVAETDEKIERHGGERGRERRALGQGSNDLGGTTLVVQLASSKRLRVAS